MSLLEPFIEKTISVITNDGHNFVGVLKGIDQLTNIIVADCHERIYTENGVQINNVGLVFILRGDNIAVIGEVDPDIDSAIDYKRVKAEPLKPVVH